jgi:hypothetical protein
MDDLVEEMAHARLAWTAPAIRAWYDDDRLLRQLADGLADEAGRVDDEEFGASFRDDVGLHPGTSPLEWANRRIRLPDGGWAVAGIRFRALDVARPFVDIVATTAPPTDDGLAAVADAVLPYFGPFAPLCLRVEPPDPSAIDGRVDQHVVAGRVDELRRWPRAASYEAVALRPGEPGPLADRAAGIYAALPRGRDTWATPEDQESLAHCADEGLLFEVVVDDTSAGVVAAIRDDRHGMSGFGVEEICLDAAARGRGLAAGVVQRLVDALPAADGDVLWGTIHPDNQPSLRNALSVGRRVVGGYVWVTPSGLPGMPRH